MKTKLNLAQALPLAEKIKAALSPGCERIEIAGSIRRRKPTVGDIEIVAIPKLIPDMLAQLSLFDEPPTLVSALDLLLENLIRDKPNFKRGGRNGDLYKNFLIEFDESESEIGIDLFLTTPEQWGYILALRIGPGDFNRAWVTQKSKGGLLEDGYFFAGGWLHGPDGKKIATRSEGDVFTHVRDGTIWPFPDDRDEWQQYY